MTQDPNPYLPGTQPISDKAFSVPPEMMLHLAAGMEEPFKIAKRYGFSEEEFAALCQWPPFQQQVEQTKAELRDKGYDFRLTNRLYANELGRKYFLMAMSNDATIGQVGEAYKTTAELGDLKPKQLAQNISGQGAKFSVVINLPSEEPLRYSVIEGKADDDTLPLAGANPFAVAIEG